MIRLMQILRGLGGAAILLVPVVHLGAARPSPEAIRFFEKRVRPLLAKHCYECHSSSADKVKGGLLLDSQAGWMDGGDSGEVLQPGKPDKSRIIRAVRYEDPDLQMPPKYRLSEDEVAILEAWVRRGAPDPRTEAAVEASPAGMDVEEGRSFWAFEPPRSRAVPQVKNVSWPKDDLDHFILKRLEEAGLSPVQDADRRTLIRRLTFDLIGLPPTPGEVLEFVNDPGDDAAALARVVDRLLASRHFGERWGRHWLDVVRYAESMGRTRNWPFPHAWRYRDYVIDAFNQDKPYDRFLIEQVAGDLLPAASPAEADALKIATGFLALGAHDLNERSAAKFKMDVVDEQVDVTSRAFMALTIGCARCHDHKFDPIPTRDYYAMAGIFRSTELRAGFSNRRGGNSYFKPDLLLALSTAPELSQEEKREARQRAKAQEQRRQALQKKLRNHNNQIRRLNRLAKQGDAGGGSGGERVTPGEARRKINGLRREVRKLRRELQSLDNVQVPKEMAMGVAEGDPVDCRIHIRGETGNLGPEVPRGFLQVLCREPVTLPEDASGRLELAEWMARPDHPLTARVMVNRLWHHLFGRGLVATVDNFGATGERPTHPELLDHLAIRFAREGWSVKSMIRSLVMSRTYRLSSQPSDAAYAVDPENLLRWRMSVRRLEVEALRDAILAVSGRLETSPPGPSPVMTTKMGELGKRGTSQRWDQSRHRSVYLPVIRNDLPGMFEVFDFAEPSSVIGRRDITTVSTQALFLMNNAFVIEQSRAMASRLIERHPSHPGERVRLAYAKSLGRPPQAGEEQRALDFLRAQGGDEAAWAGFCQALFACAEFRYLQ